VWDGLRTEFLRVAKPPAPRLFFVRFQTADGPSDFFLEGLLPPSEDGMVRGACAPPHRAEGEFQPNKLVVSESRTNRASTGKNW